MSIHVCAQLKTKWDTQALDSDWFYIVNHLKTCQVYILFVKVTLLLCGNAIQTFPKSISYEECKDNLTLK